MHVLPLYLYFSRSDSTSAWSGGRGWEMYSFLSSGRRERGDRRQVVGEEVKGSESFCPAPESKRGLTPTYLVLTNVTNPRLGPANRSPVGCLLLVLPRQTPARARFDARRNQFLSQQLLFHRAFSDATSRVFQRSLSLSAARKRESVSRNPAIVVSRKEETQRNEKGRQGTGGTELAPADLKGRGVVQSIGPSTSSLSFSWRPEQAWTASTSSR